jgi:hypothetical protein
MKAFDILGTIMLILALIIVTVIIFFQGKEYGIKTMQKQAIEKQCAVYDSYSGRFTWALDYEEEEVLEDEVE